MSPTQRRCIIEATIAPLIRFRRGYARSKSGPFWPRATTDALERTGALRRLPRPGRPLSALADARLLQRD